MPSHSSFGAVLAAVIITLLILGLGAWGAFTSGLISVNPENVMLGYIGGSVPFVDDFADQNGNGAPDDLDKIIEGLEEIEQTGTTDVPIMVQQYGNQTDISLAADGGTSSALPSSLVRDGIYSLTGSAGEGPASYSGTVLIKFREGTGNVYDLTWRIGGAQEQWGVGILQDNILSVGYYEQVQGAVRDAGVVSFKAGNGTLEGEWTSLQGGGTGYEQLKWLSQ
jgi:hypothetical protein